MNPLLVMYAPAPVIDEGATLRLDAKFVTGMAAHCAHWPGPVRCLLRRGATAIPFGAASHAPADLPFEPVLLDPGEPLGPGHVAGAAAVFADVDMVETLDLPELVHGAGGRLVYTLEYTIQTRLQIVRLDASRSAARRLWSAGWNLRQELRRRRAIRAADGLQASGYAAYEGYRHLNPRTLLYLDGRMSPGLLATEAEMAARRDRLLSGAPLRLIHSGRLERLKGAQDLAPIMTALRAAGVAATLDVYGVGSLRDDIAAEARATGLAETLRLHDAVDFETELVPLTRAGADVFLSCHRQSDPSCTYLEAMGCGLTVAGYANRMWGPMTADAGAGVAAPLGDTQALAAAIVGLDRDRAGLAEACARSLAFSRAHDFPSEYKRRMDHLKEITLG